MSDSPQSPATPQNLVSLQTTGNRKSSHRECAAEALSDVNSTPWIAESDVASTGSGKRKLLEEGESSNGAKKRVRNGDGPESGSSDTNETSLEVDDEKIGQPRVGYPITAPLVKMNSTPVRAPAALDVSQGLDVPGVAPGVVPAVAPGVVPGVAPGVVPAVAPGVVPRVALGVVPALAPRVVPAVASGVVPAVVPGVVPQVAPRVVPRVVPGMIPALPLPLGVSGGVGGVPMLSFGGAMGASALSMATIASHLQALQMNQFLRAFVPTVNNLGKLLTNEQMAMLATRMTMASRVSPQTPLLHPPRPALLSASSSSSAPSSVSTSTTGSSSNRPLQDSNTSTPGGTWVLDSVRQTLDSQREVRGTIADGDNSHSDLTIDQHSNATTENSSESDEARFRVSDAESGNGIRGGQEAVGFNGQHHLSPQPQDQGYLQQDQSYQERRRKNNDSARRSRDARRTRIDETAKRVAFLEMENLQMRAIIEAEREYLTRMQQDLMRRKGAWNQTQFAALRQVLDNISVTTSAARFYSSSGQPLVTTAKSSSAAVKEEQPNGSETHLDCDVRPS